MTPNSFNNYIFSQFNNNKSINKFNFCNQGLIGGSQNTTFLPADTMRHIFGENLTQDTFSTWHLNWAISFPSIFQAWTSPFSLPDKIYWESGVKEHYMIDDSLTKLVNLCLSVPSKASSKIILLSEVATII